MRKTTEIGIITTAAIAALIIQPDPATCWLSAIAGLILGLKRTVTAAPLEPKQAGLLLCYLFPSMLLGGAGYQTTTSDAFLAATLFCVMLGSLYTMFYFAVQKGPKTTIGLTVCLVTVSMIAAWG